MDEERRRRHLGPRSLFGSRSLFGPSSPVRSFALGGVLGAAGTIATVRRLRRSSSRARATAGLGAFEDAPCFREVVEREGHGYRGHLPDLAGPASEPAD